MFSWTSTMLLSARLLVWAWVVVAVGAQTISRPQPSLPVESYSDDPLVSASAASCTLRSILASESAPNPIGPLTGLPDCMSMPQATSSVNGQSLPSSGIATIFASSTASPNQSQATSQASASQPTSTRSSSTSSTSSTATQPQSSAPAPQQTNAAPSSRSGKGWIANQNIALMLVTTFALLAGVTYFLDELLTLLV